MENTKAQTAKDVVIEAITDALVGILKTGNSAPKVYLRVRPSGSVDVAEETSWCCSPDEYYHCVPHTLSLEVLQGTRDYSGCTEADIEANADCAQEAAEQIVADWDDEIQTWIDAGNLIEVAA
jgi:hypothetical protein